MNDDRQLFTAHVGEYLAANCVGRENAIRKASLANCLGLDFTSASEMRELHDVLAALVIDYHWPVCAACGGDMGYYLADDPADRRATVHSLRRRAIRILRRAKHLKQARLWPHVPLRQRELFEPPRPEEARAHIETGVT